MDKNETNNCGNCHFHNEYEGNDFICNNEESEYYGEITEKYEKCEQFKKLE